MFKIKKKEFLTFRLPSRIRVISIPTENISLKITDMTKSKINPSCGNVKTMANKANITSHKKPDKRKSNSKITMRFHIIFQANL